MRKLNAMEDFQRDISYRVLVLEDEKVRLTGTMKDRFHDIEVEIVVESSSLEILEVRVDFRAAPSRYCTRAEKRLERLVGVRIGRGLGRKLSETLGGGAGCGNLRTLLVGLLPLAINVKIAAGIPDEEEMLETIHHKLRGTCVGYPEVVDDDESSRRGEGQSRSE